MSGSSQSDRIEGREGPLAVQLRPPARVMRLDRLGAFHQTRLSFLRALLRGLRRGGWRFDRPSWRIDGQGIGHAVYRAVGPDHTYSLIAFSRDLPPELRTDRVIAEAWDTSYVLFDGEPTASDIDRLAVNVPLQEAGRYLQSDLVLSRANRSVRLFERVVAALASGEQPSANEVERVGYLMRTTAVYGNGKFGIADRVVIAGRSLLDGPFRAEMLTVWLIRAFTVDLAEHLAECRSPGRAARLEPALRRRFGVGNSTGLGMAPFLVRHPALFDRWILARETALARVRSLPGATTGQIDEFRRVLELARAGVVGWRVEDAGTQAKIAGLRTDLDRLARHIETFSWTDPLPWDRIYRWAEAELDLEAQEFTVTLLIEPHGELVDELADTMAVDEDARFRIDGSIPCGLLRDDIRRHYDWAIGVDYTQPEAQARFWYTSVAKLEPRLGERWEEPGGELEQPLGAGRDVTRLLADLDKAQPSEILASFLVRHPEHRGAARRVQIALASPYAEIRDNLLGARMLPVDILRCKLAFFGATRFDPRSDRWLRISLFQGAPYPHELDATQSEDWIFRGGPVAG